MLSILATSDGGCLLLGTRYDYNIQDNERDIYILKVDENGNITSINNQTIKAKEIIVYPNPCTNTINIQTNEFYKNSMLKIFDFTGKQIILKQIEGSTIQINTSNLPNGIYLYSITNQNEIIESGKFVKE